MAKSISLILLLITMTLTLSCCSRHAPDSRLIYADSLMTSHPDSAYSILKSIPRASLEGKDNKAYYALLYTQAQYKSYDSIRSDSLINIAVDFYGDNHDREKYTRALIYKGAALSDMGDKLNAMDFFLKAEKNANKSDYNTMGLIEVKLAETYQELYAGENSCIEKYKKALHYYQLCGNMKNQILCLCQIGGIYRISNNDSAFIYLKKANYIAKEIGDSTEFYNCIELMARAYEAAGNYDKEKTLSLSAINSNIKDINIVDCYYDVCIAYANIGDVEQSLSYYNKFFKEFNPSSIRESVMNLAALEEIEKARNNFKKALYYNNKSNNISDSIMLASERSRLINYEEKHKREETEIENKNIRQDNLFLLIILLCVTILLLLATFFIYYYHHRLVERTAFCEQLRTKSIISHDELLKKINTESRLRKTMESQIEIIRKLIKSSNYVNDKTSKLFVAEFKDAMKIKNDKNFWSDLRFFVDENYNHIITDLSNKYCNLNNDDINFIALICCGFSYIEIAICLGYTNSDSAAVRKRRIAIKMGLDCTLDKFINDIASN